MASSKRSAHIIRQIVEGDAEALCQLGNLCREGNGDGLSQNYVHAYAWFNLAAEQGEQDSCDAIE